MTLKSWEKAVAVAWFAIAGAFVATNASEIGYALGAADVLWVLTRIEILENHSEPAHYTVARGRLGVLKLVLLLGIYAAATWGAVIIKDDLGTKARATVIADFAIVGLCVMLVRELQISADATWNWFVGARAERKVGSQLVGLKESGWLVLHGYKKDWGDIDHIAVWPHGAYAIETKSYRFRSRDAGQTAGNAWWLRRKLGVRWVTGVLCVDEDAPPRRKDKIWVVSHRDLADWLVKQRNGPIDVDAARACLKGGEEQVEAGGLASANA